MLMMPSAFTAFPQALRIPPKYSTKVVQDNCTHISNHKRHSKHQKSPLSYTSPSASPQVVDWFTCR